LAPLTDDWPKTLFPVGDRPVIAYLFDLLKQYGIKEIVLNLHHLGDLIRENLGDGSRYSVRISYSPEEELLGTGGGVRQASRFWGEEDILVINGDNLLELNIERLILYHQASSAAVTMALKPMGAHSDYTPIYLDQDSNVVAIEGKKRSTPGYAFIGAQVITPAFLKQLPRAGPACLIKDGYRKLLRSRKDPGQIKGFITTGYWREISTFQRYRDANRDFLGGRSPFYFYRWREEFTRRGLHVGKDCRIGPRTNFRAPVYLGDGCEVGAGTTLGSMLLVGARSSIGEACGLQDVIIWPDSKIRKGSHLKEVIVTPFGKIKTG